MNIRALSRFDGALEKIAAATAPTEILEELSTVLRSFGLHHLLITGLPLPRDGPWQQQILYDGWPREWFERYTASGHFFHDPCALRCRYTVEPFLWNELSRERMTDGQLRVMDEATEFGLKDGLCVPVHSPLRAPAVVTAAGEWIELAAEDLPTLEMLCVQAFRAIRRLHMGDDGSLHHKLTDREREVLTWIAAGKAAEDVACILGISKFTVERHLSNIREKDGATNTVQAVVEAMRRGEIQP
ncbi:LuxR family quorum sensing-dependent transcriptional regulator [Mesorhizobium soli]|uniref:LuxR family transcriptional regulator n=1 Tax=Pseudaminobacter soli (ex Li et al. 2025) TaxID=1295366 RepID=UPI0024748AF6|nr:LuxR family transcriptional regulator [Mesorhizobium soli]MDH6234884.1 LuxR family quorum sensing-dependent transcriptional regulator [Mesorhizobium soli]